MASSYDLFEHLMIEVEELRHQTTEEAKEKLTELKERIESHTDCLESIHRNVESAITDMNRRILRERERIAEEQRIRARVQTSLNDLIDFCRLDNPNQYEILNRIRPNHNRWDPRNTRDVFLSSYTPNTSTDRKKANIEGEFAVLGTLRKGERESYKVTWYKQGSQVRGSFWCSCPDQKFNGSKKNIYCKHISFLICRMANLYDPEIFSTKQLSSDNHEAFKQKVTNAAVLQQVQPPPHVVPTATNVFSECGKAVEEGDSCPICYDDLANTVLLGCPTCKNNIHKECMEVWLERNQTCVYCRSTAWTHYTRGLP